MRKKLIRETEAQIEFITQEVKKMVKLAEAKMECVFALRRQIHAEGELEAARELVLVTEEKLVQLKTALITKRTQAVKDASNHEAEAAEKFKTMQAGKEKYQALLKEIEATKKALIREQAQYKDIQSKVTDETTDEATRSAAEDRAEELSREIRYDEDRLGEFIQLERITADGIKSYEAECKAHLEAAQALSENNFVDAELETEVKIAESEFQTAFEMAQIKVKKVDELREKYVLR